MRTSPGESPYGPGRVTRQRQAIARAAAGLQAAFSADDLTLALRGCGDEASVATVYRAISAMESSGFLERVGTRDGRALFALCDDSSHHHHIICDSCGRTAKTECTLDHGVDSADGFLVTRHEMTLYGLCRECADRRGS